MKFVWNNGAKVFHVEGFMCVSNVLFYGGEEEGNIQNVGKRYGS